MIDEEADRLDQLIGESLNLARIEGRRANPRTRRMPVPRYCPGRSPRRVERYLGRRELLIDVPDDLPPIIGDKFLLEQMLMQVVDNAWKYSNPGARIAISARLSGANILLSVQNEGSEIPESEQGLIFDKFYRGSKDRSQSRRYRTGAGDREDNSRGLSGESLARYRAAGSGISFCASIGSDGEKE